MIFGAVTFDEKNNVAGDVTRIAASMAGEGLECIKIDKGPFQAGFFTHHRLPCTASDFRHTDNKNEILVLLSGAIFNKEELISEYSLEPPAGDPGLIAGLFGILGLSFVEKLIGEFIIVIFAAREKKAYIFRDHVGIRPLAFTVRQGSLFFASDAVRLCKTFTAGDEIDSEFLLRYFRFTDLRVTPSESITKLPPGHYLEFSRGCMTINRYWHPEKIRTDKRMTYSSMISALSSLVTDSVKIRCDNRYTAGAHVSGGLDSGYVALLARKEYARQKSFYGFSWSPLSFTPGKVKYDERLLVRKICEAGNITPCFSEMDASELGKIISDYFNNQGYVSEAGTLTQASERDTNLIFSGWGGDEFISTGDRGIETDLLVGLRWRDFMRRNPVRPFRRFIKYFLSYVIYPAIGILDRKTRSSFRRDALYIRPAYRKNNRRAVRDYYFHRSRRQMHLRQLNLYNLQERCESWMINGYRNGVEYRYPLLDRRLIEFILRVPSELMCHDEGFRPLLRVLGEDILPHEVSRHTDKRDPVYWAFMDMLFAEFSATIAGEITEWKKIKSLCFADFTLLASDIEKAADYSVDLDKAALYRTMVYLKAVHDFTVRYREQVN